MKDVQQAAMRVLCMILFGAGVWIAAVPTMHCFDFGNWGTNGGYGALYPLAFLLIIGALCLAFSEAFQ